MTLTAAQLQRAAQTARAWQDARLLEPLRHARLWDAPSDVEGMVSQRYVLQHMGEQVTLMLGGNGSGKTEAAAQLATAVALGRPNPAARAWCEDNGIDPERLPAKPGRVLFSALTHDDSIRYHRPKIEQYLPFGTRWRNRFAQDEAMAMLPTGGLIVFKANRQGREAYQGDAFDLAILDEEHDEDVYLEVLMRVARRPRSHVLLPMTPLKGLTWVHSTFVEPRHEDASVLHERVARIASGWVRVHNVDGLANPYIPRAQTAAILAGMGEEEREARRFGRFYRTHGRVYQALTASAHLQPRPEVMPPGGMVIWGVDFGYRAPFALSVLWYDPRDEVYHVVAEYLQAQRSIKDHAKAMAEIAALYGPPDLIAADPEDASSRAELAEQECMLIPRASALSLPPTCPYHRRALTSSAPWVLVLGDDDVARWPPPRDAVSFNMSSIAARKAVKSGLMKVAGFMEKDAAGRPHFFVDPSCVQTWTQLNNLSWRESRTGEPEEVIKKDDHLPDAVRYAIVSHQHNL